MKKIIVVPLLAICMLSVVFAVNTIIIRDTVTPDIKATFNESVRLEKVNLTFIATGANILLNNKTTDNRTFTFTPKTALDNGFYYFIVKARDRIGNQKQFTENVIVDVNETSVGFIAPIHGVAKTEIYDIRLGTSRKAECRWSFQDVLYEDMNAGSFEKLSDTQFLIEDFNGENIDDSEDSGLLKFYVKCVDDLGRKVNAQLLTGYDPTPPAIERIIITENPVVNYPPTTSIIIETNDKSICYANNGVFSTQSKADGSTYDFSSTHTIFYNPPDASSNKDYTYNLYCENRAESVSPLEVRTIKVNLQAKLAITISLPRAFIGTSEVNYDIASNKPATCRATLTPGNIISDLTATQDNKHHTLTPGPSGLEENKQYVVKYVCTGGENGNENAEATRSFAVDLTPPSDSAVSAAACDSSKLSLSFSAYDNESKILGYNYTVYGPDLLVDWRFSASNKTDVGSLTLVENQTYSVDVVAINGAGSLSAITTQSFDFTPKTTIACQEKDPPEIKLNITDTSYGKRVQLICADESGCVESSILYGLSATANCTASIASTEVILQQPQTLCWEAEDVFFNKAKGSQFIPFKILGNTCTNGILDGIETDVDCGGDCLGCSVGLSCDIDTDCADLYCANSICAKPLCDDTIKNGFETDVDCGGLSCTGCSIGGVCLLDSDCATNFCTAEGICGATSCTDNQTNGFETDIDCGGSVCDACTVGSSCIESSDCETGSCQFGSCVAGEQTFEEWAAENGIDPNDKDGDADGDGLTNYEEFLHKTDPNRADTDGDGYSDSDEIKAGTDPLDGDDYPTSFFFRYLLLGVGVVTLIIGLLMLYYFRVDQATALNVVILGFGALLIVFVDWLLFQLPKSVLAVVAAGVLGGAGYFVYKRQGIIVQKLTGKKVSQQPGTTQTTQRGSTASMQAPPSIAETRREQQELDATKVMIEMLKKEREQEIRKREEVFEKFGKEAKREEAKPGKKEQVIEPIKKKESIIQPKVTKLTLPERKEVDKGAFDRLGDMTKGAKASDVEKLGRLGGKGSVADLERLKRKEDAFERLSGMSKSKVEDVFSKLPASKKGLDALSELEKERLKKQKKKR
jgi:hypothetical protein